MTDQTTESTATPGSPSPQGQPEPARRPGFEERIEGFGREAEAAGQRWSRDPGVVRAADTAGRVWGLLVLLVGLWFFADVTLGMDMPSIPWRDVWPVGLIVVGLAVVLRGLGRRRA